MELCRIKKRSFCECCEFLSQGKKGEQKDNLTGHTRFKSLSRLSVHFQSNRSTWTGSESRFASPNTTTNHTHTHKQVTVTAASFVSTSLTLPETGRHTHTYTHTHTLTHTHTYIHTICFSISHPLSVFMIHKKRGNPPTHQMAVDNWLIMCTVFPRCKTLNFD